MNSFFLIAVGVTLCTILGIATIAEYFYRIRYIGRGKILRMYCVPAHAEPMLQLTPQWWPDLPENLIPHEVAVPESYYVEVEVGEKHLEGEVSAEFYYTHARNDRVQVAYSMGPIFNVPNVEKIT